MKNLIRNLWDAPGSTIAAGIIAALGVLTATDTAIPKEWSLGLSAVAAFLAAFSGPNKK